MHKGFACPSGYPVLLLPRTSQWHFIIIAVCKYSLQVRPSCSPEELTDCHVRECSSHFYSFSWSLAALDIEFQNFSSVQRREKAAGHKNSFETSLSPVSSYPVAAQSLRCPLPLVTVQMAWAPPWGSSTPGWRGGTGWGRGVWAPLQSDLPAQPSVSL